MIDVFPTNQQEQIRVMLAATLEGVVTQQLVVNADGTGRVPCSEVLMCTSAIRNLIRQSKTHQIYSLMQVGARSGCRPWTRAWPSWSRTASSPRASPTTAPPTRKTFETI